MATANEFLKQLKKDQKALKRRNKRREARTDRAYKALSDEVDKHPIASPRFRR